MIYRLNKSNLIMADYLLQFGLSDEIMEKMTIKSH